MLLVGLTGGIGAGKSTVARRLAERGAVLIDSDVLSRAVVAPGTAGLAAVRAAFGSAVLGPDGTLDRAALARTVFADPAARQRLNAIVHPLVRARSDALRASAPADAVVVQDVPLLVEGGLGPAFHLVAVVHAGPAERVRRLTADRGMTEADAQARLAAQADDGQRRAAADVWLDNSGAIAELLGQVDRLWVQRLRPFEANLRLRRPAAEGDQPVADPDPSWPGQAARLAARVVYACGLAPDRVQHVGPTAVPGLPAVDVLELALAAASPAAVRPALDEAGFPRQAEDSADPVHAAADPGRLAHLLVCSPGSARWRRLLLVRDWLRADPAARAEYAAATRRGTGPAWLDAASGRMEQWARAGRWSVQRGTAPVDRG